MMKNESTKPKLKPIYGVKIPNFPRCWLVGAIPEEQSAAWPIKYSDKSKEITMLVAPKSGEWRVFVLEENADMMFQEQLLIPKNFRFNTDKDLYVATDGKQVAIVTKDEKKLKIDFGVEATYRIYDYFIFIGKPSDVKDFDTLFEKMEILNKVRETKKAGMRSLV
jgi:hypothetical protein